MNDPAKTNFDGLCILSLESRRAEQMATMIRNHGGSPIVAPSMREVPLDDNHDALAFAAELTAGRVDVVIFLTGGGARILLRAVEAAGNLPEFVAALKSVPVVARGPKPVAALAEFGLRPNIIAPEPNTWRELMQAMDHAASPAASLQDKTVAIQEYGTGNQELMDALVTRGAKVLRVPVYDWQLPEDIGPLREAIRTLAAGRVDVVLFTTSVQVRHLMKVAEQMGLANEIPRACAKAVVASVGPLTSEELRRFGFPVDLEPSHPKMGFLVKETAEQSASLLSRKRSQSL